MRWVLGVIVVLPAVALVIGAIRGRVRVRSCCAVDAAHDKRMLSAYSSEPVAARAPVGLSQEPVTGDRAAW